LVKIAEMNESLVTVILLGSKIVNVQDARMLLYSISVPQCQSSLPFQGWVKFHTHKTLI